MFKRRNATGFSRIPSRLAHRTRPIRQSWDVTTLSRLLPPSPPTRGSGCLQLHPAATTARRWTVSHLHSEHQRLVAHQHDMRQHSKWLENYGFYPFHRPDLDGGLRDLRDPDTTDEEE